MYLLILVLPFCSAMLSFLAGRFLGKYGVIQISSLNLLISWGLNLQLLYSSLAANSFLSYNLGNWFSYTSGFEVSWEFQFDLLCMVMIFVVTAISGLVHVYAWNYMAGDPFIIRFIALLSLFTFFMLILVSSANFVQLFLGWEGIGLCSYFLIGFWYTRVQANKSALKAIIVNRVGDIAFLIAIGAIITLCQTTDFSIVFATLPLYSGKTFFMVFGDWNIVEFICFWLMLAAIGKSAQIGLHTWLPDAMEGPTPVSALIHAATMVTAGIFLIIRCSFIFEYAPSVLLMISVIGSCTAIFAATSGMFQNDIKKVIAYSTCSQLGYMFYACGLSNYAGSFFHLTTHAFFKALLFLSAGSVIHAVWNEQDMRKMGGLRHFLPVTYISFIIGSLALAGFPFLSGFYSKDFILEQAMFSSNPVHIWGFCLATITAIFTIIYSVRLLYLVFWSPVNTPRVIFRQVSESSWVLLAPLVILGLCSLLVGYITKDFFIGYGNQFFSDVIFCAPKSSTIYEVENLLGVKTIPTYFNYTVAGVYLGTSILLLEPTLLSYLLTLKLYRSDLYLFMVNKWYFDVIYFNLLKVLFGLCYQVWTLLDKGLLEILQPIGFTLTLNWFSNKYTKFNAKTLTFYSFCSGYGFIILLMSYSLLKI